MKKIFAVIAITIAAIALFAGGASAAKLITGKDIQNESVTGADVRNQSLSLKELNPSTANRILNPHGKQGPQGEVGPQGVQGEVGPQGVSGLDGAYYAIADYNAGDTNAGAIATVACEQPSDTAISGGVQTLGTFGGTVAAVGDSFPGRMDWNTNTPKPDRLDGWIVQFDAQHPPLKTRIWALCVPNLDIRTSVTYQQVS